MTKTKSPLSYKTWLKIADVTIELLSAHCPETFDEELDWRFKPFLLAAKRHPDIVLEIHVGERLPDYLDAADCFITYHYSDGKENWRLQTKNNKFIFKSPIKSKELVAQIEADFSKASVWLLPKSGELIWHLSDIIYDFLQVFLINYLATRDGIFVHSVGIKDRDGKGILFPGLSGSGKSTTARLWSEHSKAMVLNDDRVIIRKREGRYFIYGTPWHGDFSDYLRSEIEAAELEVILFLYHAKSNQARAMGLSESFKRLYTSLFLAFAGKEQQSQAVEFAHELLISMPSYDFGFRKDKSAIAKARQVKNQLSGESQKRHDNALAC